MTDAARVPAAVQPMDTQSDQSDLSDSDMSDASSEAAYSLMRVVRLRKPDGTVEEKTLVLDSSKFETDPPHPKAPLSPPRRSTRVRTRREGVMAALMAAPLHLDRATSMSPTPGVRTIIPSGDTAPPQAVWTTATPLRGPWLSQTVEPRHLTTLPAAGDAVSGRVQAVLDRLVQIDFHVDTPHSQAAPRARASSFHDHHTLEATALGLASPTAHGMHNAYPALPLLHLSNHFSSDLKDPLLTPTGGMYPPLNPSSLAGGLGGVPRELSAGDLALHPLHPESAGHDQYTHHPSRSAAAAGAASMLAAPEYVGVAFPKHVMESWPGYSTGGTLGFFAYYFRHFVHTAGQDGDTPKGQKSDRDRDPDDRMGASGAGNFAHGGVNSNSGSSSSSSSGAGSQGINAPYGFSSGGQPSWSANFSGTTPQVTISVQRDAASSSTAPFLLPPSQLSPYAGSTSSAYPLTPLGDSPSSLVVQRFFASSSSASLADEALVSPHAAGSGSNPEHSHVPTNHSSSQPSAVTSSSAHSSSRYA